MENEKNIILIVISGTLILVMLIMAIIVFVVTYNKKLQERINLHTLEIKNKELELLKSVIETQEAEREKITSNLHDEVGPLISRLKLDLSGMKRAFQKKKLTIEKFEQKSEFIDSIIDNIRSVSHDLSPSFLIKFGLSKAINNYATEFSDIKTTISNSPEEEVIYARLITTNVYRTLLELINNVVKHDKCSELEIQFLHSTKNLQVLVNHNGKGITNEEFNSFASSSKGLGLTSIQSRILILNANLEFETKLGEPKISLPIPVE